MPSIIEAVVKIDGKDICEKMPVESIETYTQVNELPYAIIRINDFINISSEGENLFANDSSLKIGGKVEIELGEKDKMENIFTGIILEKNFRLDAKDNFCFVELKVVSKAQELDIVKKSSFFSDKTDADIIKAVVGTHSGVSVKTGKMALKHESLLQNDITDWEFIKMRARAYGFVVGVDKDAINVDAPQLSGGEIEATMGENIIEFNLRINGTEQFEKIAAKIWDVKTQKGKDVKGENIAEKSFGNVQYGDITKQTSKQELIVYSNSIKEEEAKSINTALLTLNRFSKIIGEVVIIGNGKAKCNAALKISKCAECFNGKAYISGVQHSFEDGEWLTKLTIGYDYSNTSYNMHGVGSEGSFFPYLRGLKYGKVINIAGDKENNYRVHVHIPLFNKEGEGIWCRLASTYASTGAGIFFFPEVKDEVIVGFIDNDFRNGIILGAVYNSVSKPPLDKIDATNEKKIVCTKGKIEICFDDKDKILQLKTPDKKEITISDKDGAIQMKNGDDVVSIIKGEIKIKCAKDLSIEGKNVNIKASGSINLKATSDVKIEGANVNAKGSMAANIEGGTGANLKSSGITAVKGTMVNIN